MNIKKNTRSFKEIDNWGRICCDLHFYTTFILVTNGAEMRAYCAICLKSAKQLPKESWRLYKGFQFTSLLDATAKNPLKNDAIRKYLEEKNK